MPSGVGDHDRLAAAKRIERRESGLDQIRCRSLAIIGNEVASREVAEALPLLIIQPDRQPLDKIVGSRRGCREHEHGSGVFGGQRRDDGRLGCIGQTEGFGSSMG